MFYKIVDKSAPDTVIVCSSIHTEVGRFRFERQIEAYDVNAIFLNCPNNEWYLNGVPGLGDSPSAVRAALYASINERFSGTKLFGIGSSMGASGIIMLTAGLPMTRTYAFCPEIDLFGDFSFSQQHYNGSGSAKKDIWGELKDHSSLTVFYGEECEHDLHQLTRIKSQTDHEVQTFRDQPHGVIEAIYFTEGMTPLLQSLRTGSPLRPMKIHRGHISGSLNTCRVLWKAFVASKNRSRSIPDLRSVYEATAKDRSYYPLLLYWLSRFSDGDTKVGLLEEAHETAPMSLRIASELFRISPDPHRASDFKKSFVSHFGKTYTGSSRSAAIHTF